MASLTPPRPGLAIGAPRTTPTRGGPALIKGTALRSTVSAIPRVAGEGGVARVLAALPPHVRDEVERGPLASKWYPTSFSAALHLAIHDALGGGTWLMNHKVGVEAARIDYRGVYRTVLWALDIDGLLDRLPPSWRQYNSRGEATIEKGPGRATACVAGVTGFNQGMWTAIAGRVEGLLTMGRAKSAVARVAHATESSCQIDIRWSRLTNRPPCPDAWQGRGGGRRAARGWPLALGGRSAAELERTTGLTTGDAFEADGGAGSYGSEPPAKQLRG
jgi:hypothetical protein